LGQQSAEVDNVLHSGDICPPKLEDQVQQRPNFDLSVVLVEDVLRNIDETDAIHTRLTQG